MKKGAAMIIDSLGLCFHIQCFKCGVCKGLLGDTSTGTDVRIRNGVLNCHSCYMKSRAAGQPPLYKAFRRERGTFAKPAEPWAIFTMNT